MAPSLVPFSVTYVPGLKCHLSARSVSCAGARGRPRRDDDPRQADQPPAEISADGQGPALRAQADEWGCAAGRLATKPDTHLTNPI